MNIVTEIRNRITQYIETSLIDQDICTCEYGATCNASKAEGRKMMLNVCDSVENALKNREIPQWATATADNRILRHSDKLQLKSTQCRDILRC